MPEVKRSRRARVCVQLNGGPARRRLWGGGDGGTRDKLEMTIRPRGGNLHENRSRAERARVCVRPVHSARIDVRVMAKQAPGVYA